MESGSNSSSGFTLLETMIAMAIMVVAFAAILLVESGSIKTTERAREMNIVSMLAKNTMIQAEFEFEGKSMDELKKEVSDQFKPPYQDYTWTRTIKEIEFPNLGVGANSSKSSSGGGDESDGGGDSGVDAMTAMMSKLVTQFLSKAVREVTVTISWKRGPGVQKLSVTTYWVDLNHEFQVSE